MTSGTRRSGKGGALVGLVLLTLGAVMLLHEQHLFHVGNAWRLWPLFMIVVGLHGLFDSGRRHLLHSLLVVGMGFLFLAINFHLWGLRMRHFAPVVVLIVGLSFVIDAIFGRRKKDEETIDGGVS
ncbi:MAG TPA: DUF5668 domain-containing protein [Candidatus Eisenbacteria bacterium]